MKKVVLKFGMALLFGAALSFAACGGGAQSSAETTEQHADDHDHDAADHDHADHDHSGEAAAMAGHGEGKEYTSAYICPMHCEGSGADAAGNCPKCGMAYITKADHDAKPHSH